MFKKIQSAFLIFFIKTLGRLSTGIRMCFEYGLTSGRMLEYIYEDRAQGKFFIGRIIDRIYLNHPDWQAVRERKDNVKNYIKEVVFDNRKENIPTVILDIAAGYARYILEALREAGQENTEVICLDTEPKYKEEVSNIFRKEGFSLRYENRSAFDKDFILTLRPPKLIISSGFYDWLIEDNLVENSIKDVYEVLPDGGYFVLTGQGKHPDLELVSKAFSDFRREPLRMKMRSVEQITGFLEKVGFKEITHKSDRWGYYYAIRGRK